MFRIISTSGISTIKAKVGTQVGQVALRNSINNINISSRRLNTTLHNTIEQDIWKPPHYNNRSASYSKNSRNNDSRGNNRNNNNARNSNVRQKNNRENQFNLVYDIPHGKDNPMYHQLVAFEDCVNINSSPRATSPYHHDPQFWDSIHRAMALYQELSGTADFNSERVGKLIYLLHTGLRQNRQQTLKLDKKPDFDARNFYKDMMDYICVSLRNIAGDIISNKNPVNEYGAMHLITSFKELQLSSEAISIWESARSSMSGDVFLDPRVVGVILPLMYENGYSFSDIQMLYETSKGMVDYFHPNLAVGMVRACLLANEINFALKLFEFLCDGSQKTKFSYLTEIHLSFIGESNDLTVANSFFETALYNRMAYKVDLQVPYVKKFIINTWNQTKNFDNVLDIWAKCWSNYGNSVTKGVSSSLNELFLSIFFSHYEKDKINGFEKLKQIIQVYANIKPLDEPFLNIVMSKCVIWADVSIINLIFDYYSFYNVNRTQVAYRVGLKAMGSINVSEQDLLRKWDELILFSDFQGATFIHNADWAALRDATIASKFSDRVLFYAKIVKAYSRFSKDLHQIKMLTDINCARYPYIAPVMADLDNIDTSSINIPIFKNIRHLN